MSEQVVMCRACDARGRTPKGLVGHDDCDGCMGFGWHWADGRPPTLCAAEGAPDVRPGQIPHGAQLPRSGAYALPCARGPEACPGCGRSRDEIGGPADVAITRERRPWLKR